MAIVRFYTNCGTEPTTGQTRVMWEIGTLRMYGHALPRGRGYTFTCPKEFQIHTEQQTRSGATRRTAIEAAQLLLKWAGYTTNVRELEYYDDPRTWSSEGCYSRIMHDAIGYGCTKTGRHNVHVTALGLKWRIGEAATNCNDDRCGECKILVRN